MQKCRKHDTQWHSLVSNGRNEFTESPFASASCRCQKSKIANLGNQRHPSQICDSAFFGFLAGKSFSNPFYYWLLSILLLATLSLLSQNAGYGLFCFFVSSKLNCSTKKSLCHTWGSTSKESPQALLSSKRNQRLNVVLLLRTVIRIRCCSRHEPVANHVQGRRDKLRRCLTKE